MSLTLSDLHSGMLFDPSANAAKTTRTANRNVVDWTLELLPAPIKTALASDPMHVQANVREVQCNDPGCSPIDTVLMLIFKNGRRAMTGMPMVMAQVTRADVERAIAELGGELMACHEDRDFQHGAIGPALTATGQAALERIIDVLRRELTTLNPMDIAAVCSASMDVLEQIEEEALRPPATQMIQQGAQRGMDPNTKILSAAQKNDVMAIQTYVQQEGISPSFANSLGQTPLHIAAMWGNAETVDFLIKVGANVHAVNQLSHATPLHVAASSNKDIERRAQCAALLLQAGADPNQRDADGLAPWQKVQDDAAGGGVLLRNMLLPPGMTGRG